MKNFPTIVSMALVLVTVSAVSAYCGNASVVNASQAKSESPETASKQTIPNGLLAAEIAPQDSQGGAGNTVAEDKTIGTPPIGTPGTGDPVPGCTNGKAVGNKHCVASPSK